MTAPKDKALDLTELRRRFTYDEHTGLLTYNKGVSNAPESSIAGSLHSSGYVNISYDNRLYRAHRLIWYYVHGVWPRGFLDHINGNRSDNRLCNLREATHSVNMRNKRIAHNNNKTSKYLGVYYKHNSKSWHAHIRASGKSYYLGKFDNEEEANAAYLSAKKVYHNMGQEELKEFISEVLNGTN